MTIQLLRFSRNYFNNIVRIQLHSEITWLYPLSIFLWSIINAIICILLTLYQRNIFGQRIRRVYYTYIYILDNIEWHWRINRPQHPRRIIAMWLRTLHVVLNTRVVVCHLQIIRQLPKDFRICVDFRVNVCNVLHKHIL